MHKKKYIFKKNIFYRKLVNLILKKGLKKKAGAILNLALLNCSLKTNLKIETILVLIFKKLRLQVETKKIKIRRRFHLVPYPIKFKRKIFLLLNWILFVSRNNKLKTSFSHKLSIEFIEILKKNSLSRTEKIKNFHLQQGLKNRSNSHFRW